MHLRAIDWVRESSKSANWESTLSEHLDDLGFDASEYQDPQFLRSLFDEVSREVERLHLPVRVVLICPLRSTTSAFARPLPSLAEVWRDLRVAEPPSLYLAPIALVLAKEEVVEAKAFFPCEDDSTGIYLRTFRRVSEPEEVDSYDSALYLESFKRRPR